LYSTKDLALAELQDSEFNPDKILHIVASEQTLYFRQLFETLKHSNPRIAKKQEHLSYELVILPTGKMSSREGKVVLYDDTLSTLVDLVKEEIIKRGAKLTANELNKRAKKIALAAIKYTMLSHDPKKTITFDEKETMQFEGDTGPYLQYTHARACSILRKSGKKPKTGMLSESIEFELSKKLSVFPSILEKASDEYKVHYVTNYLFGLSSLFNEFYHNIKVIGSDNECARLALIKATANVINKGLFLLGIDALDEM
jgi:arginyl-tRNA synthetase